MHFKISLLAILSSFLVFTSAVNLIQYTRPRCFGQRAACNNIGPRVCCQSTRRVFVAGTCTGCTSTDFHITWHQSGRNYCGRSASSTNGRGCIGGQNLRGHSWCRLCRTLTLRGESGPETCTSTAEPDALEIGNKWFSVNESVAEDDKNALWALWGAEVADDSVPQNLLKYQTEGIVEDEGDDVQTAEANADDEPGEPDVDLPVGGTEHVASA